MQVALGDDATYLVTRVCLVSFCIPLGDVLELDDTLYVLGLTKKLCSMSAMIDQRIVAKFDDQHVIIRTHNQDLG